MLQKMKKARSERIEPLLVNRVFDYFNSKLLEPAMKPLL